VPYPNLISVSVFNTAGELVKKIVSSPARGGLSSVEFIVQGGNGQDLMLAEGSLDIVIAGIEVPESYGTGIAVFTWDGKNEQGQYGVPGLYYVTVEETDPYGHTATITKEITLVNLRGYVELRVFNNAGELVRTIRDYSKNGKGYKLTVENIPDVFTLYPGGENDISIKFTSDMGDAFSWDGRNENGLVVSNGIYQIQIVLVNEYLGNMAVSKTVMLLGEGITDFVGNVIIVPNPYRGEAGGFLEIRWDGATQGNARIMILNAAGELVRELAAALESGVVSWDTKTGSGAAVSNGVYVVIVECKSAAGYLDRKVQKMAILRKF
jgi:flagellar hook assembly protein FlgD